MDKVRHVPSLQGLQALVEVAESGSFTQAAQTLCLTQSAISRKIQQLEAHFGVTLFVRTSRSVRMTVEGEQVLASARGILEQLKLLEDRLSPPNATVPYPHACIAGRALVTAQTQ